MQKRKLVEPFVYVAFSSLELRGAKEWMARNPSKVEALVKWVEQSGIEHPIEVPKPGP